jgi:hypothetical protein
VVEIYVQGFANGDARDADPDALRAALAPYVTGDGTRLRVGDADAELFLTW